MPATETPLRYPGGKSQVYEQIASILSLNNVSQRTYVEPFAGGAGLALKLLLRGDVPAIVLNDIDPAIANFWLTVLSTPNYLCDRLVETPVDVSSWFEQRAIYEDDSLKWTPQHAFATLFLNRTSRSGILRGGPIGGRSQSGSTKIDARLTPVTIKNLRSKIEKISRYRDRITIHSKDAVELLQDLSHEKDEYFIYADPPYITKGAALYHNSFTQEDHRRFGAAVMECHCPFIVSYDEHPLACEIYERLRMRPLVLRYSLNRRQRTQEYLFFSRDLQIPDAFDAD